MKITDKDLRLLILSLTNLDEEKLKYFLVVYGNFDILFNDKNLKILEKIKNVQQVCFLYFYFMDKQEEQSMINFIMKIIDYHRNNQNLFSNYHYYIKDLFKGYLMKNLVNNNITYRRLYNELKHKEIQKNLQI